MSGLFILGGAVAGHRLTIISEGCFGEPAGAKDFIKAVAGINLTGISSDILLKLLAHQLSDHDRSLFMIQVVGRNRALFIADAHSKRFGVPGFYRFIE